MSKKDSANTVVEETNNVVKEDVKLDESLDRAVEAISTLRAQLSEHLKQEQYHFYLIYLYVLTFLFYQDRILHVF